ncbi:MAG: hypothetical protein U0Q07_02555 [Acidimicrobiales bacterium]
MQTWFDSSATWSYLLVLVVVFVVCELTFHAVRRVVRRPRAGRVEQGA